MSGHSLSLDLEPFRPAADRVYSGIWWDPDKSGQGVAMSQQDNDIWGSWYVYDEHGIDIWLLFTGKKAGDLMSTQLLRYTGPALGDPWDTGQVLPTVVGNVDLMFKDAKSVNFDFTVDGVSGQLDLVPFR